MIIKIYIIVFAMQPPVAEVSRVVDRVRLKIAV